MLAELLAVVCGSAYPFASDVWKLWLAVGSAIALAIATVASQCARQDSVLIRTARRLAMQSLAFERDVVSEELKCVLEAILSTHACAMRVSLSDWYLPTTPAGHLRLREIYAHSAHYTYRIFATLAIISGIGCLALLAASFGVLLAFAAAGNSASPPSGRLHVLDILVSIVFTTITLRLAILFLESLRTCMFAKHFRDKVLIATPSAAVDLLCLQYDFHRLLSPTSSGRIYSWMRRGIAREWTMIASKAFNPTSTPPDAAAPIGR